MEVAPSGPQILSKPLRRRGTPVPLSQLVEESRSRASISSPLLDTKIYSKLRRNTQILAEPSELHFSGFELGRSYIKFLKLINISSEVMNIHLVPTQTTYFQTTCTTKCRLLPGLTHTLKVAFRPDEWRYFYDCVRVHYKDEENLFIPVHAYPVIDDLRVPHRVDLPAVPLGQSICHALPLRCSCPVDFEFQVFVIQQHEAFSVQPLTGVIPARGEARITLTFSPRQYETCQFIFQLVIPQFNTKPYLCTVTGSSAPHLALRHLDQRDLTSTEIKKPAKPGRKRRQSSTNEANKLKRDQGDVKHQPTPWVDVCTPAGVAKMLIKDINKLTSKDLKRALSCGSRTGNQSRQMKEALFMKKVQQVEKEEQANHLRWQVHLGLDPISAPTCLQIMEEREMNLVEYTVKDEELKQEVFTAEQTKLSSTPVLRDAGQVPDGSPSFQFYPSIHLELKQRALRGFQQAARKVLIRCRMNRRLSSLKTLTDRMKNPPSAEEITTSDLRVPPDKMLPSSFPIFSDLEEPFALRNLDSVPVDAVGVTVTARIPFFKLQVPQHYELMGYRPASTWEVFNNYTPATLARPLRTGSPDTLEPVEVEREQSRVMEINPEEELCGLSFKPPEVLRNLFPSNPLRIFNPNPGLQTYKPKHLEFDLESLSRYSVPKGSVGGFRTQTLNTQKFSDRKEAIDGVVKWGDSDIAFVNSTPDQLSEDAAPRRSIDIKAEILPLAVTPPALHDDLPPLTEDPCEGVQLTPEIIRAEVLLEKLRSPIATSPREQQTGTTSQR